MKLSIGGVLADAADLWRAERDLILRVAGVFFLLPILALAMIVTTMPPIAEPASEAAMLDAVRSFYTANFLWLLLVSVALDMGALALLKLFFGRGQTVGELLTSALVRLLPFVLLGFLTGTIINLGFALYVVPGLYIFGRCWMMGAAYAAEPDRGLFAAVERGFRLSTGNGWRIALLGCGTAAIAGSGVLLLVVMAQALAVLAGSAVVKAVALVPVAAAGAAAYVAFTLVRVAVYRRLAGSSNGM